MKNMLQQILAGQVKGQQETSRQIAEIHSKMDGGYNDLQAKIDNLQSHVKNLDNQVAQVASSAKRPMGSLPASSEPSPKGFCNTILASSSKIVESDHKREVDELSKLLEKGTVVAPMVEKQEAPKVEVPAYEPPIPFPGRILTKAKKKVFSSFKASMDKIGVPLPPMDNLLQVPRHIAFIEAILANREKVEEVIDALHPPCATPLEPKAIPKLKDPGTFLISCSLGDLNIDNALCDSGASVNVMSVNMMESLGIKAKKQTSSTITFGDASSIQPFGVIEDYPLKIGDCLIPTDFMIVERVQPNKLPLILGTSFLNTAGASIDFPNKRVTLLHVNPKVHYPIQPSSIMLCGTLTHREKPIEKMKNVKPTLELQTKEIEVLDGNCLELLFEKHLEKKVMGKPPPKKRHIPSLENELSPPKTLTPLRHLDGTIQYAIKFKGCSTPFASVKAILSPEYKDKGQAGVEALMKTVLTLALKDHPCSSTLLAPLPKVPD